MILANVLSRLVEMDTDLLLAINGARAEWADFFMYAFSGKWIWVPLYGKHSVKSIFYAIYQILTFAHVNLYLKLNEQLIIVT